MKVEAALARNAIERAKETLPSLRAAVDVGNVRRSIKCVLAPAVFDDDETGAERAVVVKALFHDESHRDATMWRWYLDRERALHERFRAESPPLGPNIRVPKLIASGPGFLVFERFFGEPLAATRHGSHASIDDATWTQLLEMRRNIRDWPRGLALTDDLAAPDDASQNMIRKRLLEDPRAPLEWMTDGISRGHERGILTARQAELATKALWDHATATCFSHGDLLLRNVIAASTSTSTSTPQLALVDWECAGRYLEGWDAALLWVWAPAHIKDQLRADYRDETPAKERAFLACIAFAFVREIAYRGQKRRQMRQKRDAVVERLERDLTSVVSELT